MLRLPWLRAPRTRPRSKSPGEDGDHAYPKIRKKVPLTIWEPIDVPVSYSPSTHTRQRPAGTTADPDVTNRSPWASTTTYREKGCNGAFPPARPQDRKHQIGSEPSLEGGGRRCPTDVNWPGCVQRLRPVTWQPRGAEESRRGRTLDENSDRSRLRGGARGS